MFVVKIGGTEGVNTQNVLDDLAARLERDPDERFVVVHGGSAVVDELGERLGHPPRYVESPSGMTGRYTDEETMEIFKMAMPGMINSDLVESLQGRGVDAVGLSGMDGRLLEGERKDTLIAMVDGKKKVLRGDHSGTIDRVNDELLTILLDAGYRPVVSVPMISHEGVACNTDADRSAAAIAGALGCDLVLLTDVPGVYRDPDDEESLIESVAADELGRVKEEFAEGKMKKKVHAAGEALDGGAGRVVVGSANREEPVSAALDGTGTVFEGG